MGYDKNHDRANPQRRNADFIVAKEEKLQRHQGASAFAAKTARDGHWWSGAKMFGGLQTLFETLHHLPIQSDLKTFGECFIHGGIIGGLVGGVTYVTTYAIGYHKHKKNHEAIALDAKRKANKDLFALHFDTDDIAHSARLYGFMAGALVGVVAGSAHREYSKYQREHKKEIQAMPVIPVAARLSASTYVMV